MRAPESRPTASSGTGAGAWAAGSARPPSARAAAARRPRLLVVGPLPPPVGGVETVTQAVLESPAFAGFDVAHCDITRQGAKETQGRFAPANFAWAARHFARMVHAAFSFRPDLVYFPIAGNLSAVLRDLTLGRIGRAAGARLLAHQHAGDIERTLARGGLLRRAIAAGFARCDRVLVLGEHWRPLLAGFGVRAPIFVVPSTLRREVFERGMACAREALAGGPVRALFVGQYGRGKGTLDLLEAVARVRGRGLDLRLTCVGPAQREGDEAAVREKRRALGLEAVAEFPGLLLGEDLYRRFGEADLFVLPSYGEGLPVVLYEAGAFGLPVITTPVGAIPDLIRDGENGLLVAPGDVEPLAAAITALATDPGRRVRLGARLREDVQSFHPDRICERIAGHCRAVLEEAGGAVPGAVPGGPGGGS